jgi:tetratricopeptide (TPR) repeat protein/histone H3/H4
LSFRARVLVPLVLCLAAALPARAAREWYDYYLQARDQDIPARRWADCIRNVDQALKLRPNPDNNARTYGMGLVPYLPYYLKGICLQGQEDYHAAIEAFNREEAAGAIRKTNLHADLIRRRGAAQDGEAARLARDARRRMQQLVREAQELGRKRAWDEALALLAQAEVLARQLDPDTLRAVTREQERQRAAKDEAGQAEARAGRLEQLLADGERLLAEGRATEAKVAFDEALGLDPQNARALEGRRAAEDRILASTTRAAREKAYADGKALVDARQLEAALGPLSDAAADPTFTDARELLAETRRVLEGLRVQKKLREDIDALAARGDEMMAAGRFPEAQVAFEGVLRLDPDHARAREGLAEAERRTGEALLARWLPNREPSVALFEPEEGPVVEAPTLFLQGFATDDRGIQKIEFRVGARLIDELMPESTPVKPARSVQFNREFPLEPGPNWVAITAFDSGGLTGSVSFAVERRLRFHETRYFLPSAAAGAVGLVGLGWGMQRMRRRRAFRQRFNPYIAGAPVLDDDMFYGREKLTARMLSTLHRNSLMITGERRIGKTTFLHHLKRVLAEDEAGDWRFFPVFVDLQGVPEQAFFHALMAEGVDTLDLSPPTRAALRFTPDPAGYDARDFAHDLQQVISELKGRTDRRVRLALLIDEVDVLNEYSDSVNQRLRGIFMKSFSENLVAVMSGVGIRRRWKSEVSPWYNFFDEIELTPFSREEAEALVREPVAGVFRWQPQAVERVLELSQLKPYLVQKLCVHAVNHMLEAGRSTIRREDVEVARAAVTSEDVDGEPAIPEPAGSVAD